MKLLQKTKGFTLIELVIIIIIIGILLASAIPNFLSFREKRKAEAEKLKPSVTVEETVNKNRSL
jgi:prepilin-type N-terminal cleavage/methylation domain-containing protein